MCLGCLGKYSVAIAWCRRPKNRNPTIVLLRCDLLRSFQSSPSAGPHQWFGSIPHPTQDSNLSPCVRKFKLSEGGLLIAKSRNIETNINRYGGSLADFYCKCWGNTFFPSTPHAKIDLIPEPRCPGYLFWTRNIVVAIQGETRKRARRERERERREEKGELKRERKFK